MKYTYANYTEVDTTTGEHCLDYENISNNEGVQSGIGLRFARETRDNRFNARKGSFFFFEYMNFGKWLGSEFAYNTLSINYRKYITPLKWLTIAGEVTADVIFGDPPVQSLSLMGGDRRMRGIYKGRFRDKTIIDTQVEFRFPIVWIFGGVLFTGLGEVGETFESYTWQGIKWTYGGGLRLTVHEETRTNLRFDIGFFQGEPLYFFTFSEAF
jgi:outer membrane protein assembly factor BamA